MISTSVMIMLAVIFPMVVTVVMMILSTKKNMDREKAAPFECGFDPKSSARIPFSLRFFLLAVIFLVFDVEIVLLIPIPMAMDLSLNSSIISSALFLIILIIGLMHEWREGSLNWEM